MSGRVVSQTRHLNRRIAGPLIILILARQCNQYGTLYGREPFKDICSSDRAERPTPSNLIGWLIADGTRACGLSLDRATAKVLTGTSVTLKWLPL